MVGSRRMFKVLAGTKVFLPIALILSFYFNMTYRKFELLSTLRCDTMFFKANVCIFEF